MPLNEDNQHGRQETEHGAAAAAASATTSHALVQTTDSASNWRTIARQHESLCNDVIVELRRVLEEYRVGANSSDSNFRQSYQNLQTLINSDFTKSQGIRLDELLQKIDENAALANYDAGVLGWGIVSRYVNALKAVIGKVTISKNFLLLNKDLHNLGARVDELAGQLADARQAETARQSTNDSNPNRPKPETIADWVKKFYEMISFERQTNLRALHRIFETNTVAARDNPSMSTNDAQRKQAIDLFFALLDDCVYNAHQGDDNAMKERIAPDLNIAMLTNTNGFTLPTDMHTVGRRAWRVNRLLLLTEQRFWPETFFPPAFPCKIKLQEYEQHYKSDRAIIDLSSTAATAAAAVPSLGNT